MTSKPKIPRKPPEQVKSTRIFIRVTADQRERLMKRASENRLTVTDWIVKRCG